MSGAVAMDQRSFYQRVMLDEAVFCADIAAADKESAIRSMVRLLLKGKGYSHDFVEAMAYYILAREELGSTGVGIGFALPHTRAPAPVSRLHLGWFLCPGGVDFAAIDGEKCYLFMCWVSPRGFGAERDRMLVLERVSHLMKVGVIDKMVHVSSDNEMRSVIEEALDESA